MTHSNDKPPREPPQTYDLAGEPEELGAKPAINPSYVPQDRDDKTPASHVPREETPPSPKASVASEEPLVVDPAQAAARRETERIRAAQQLDQEDRRKRRIKRIVMAWLIGLALIAWLIGRWL